MELSSVTHELAGERFLNVMPGPVRYKSKDLLYVTPVLAGMSKRENVTARQAACLQSSRAARSNERKRTKFKEARINRGKTYFVESPNKFYPVGCNFQFSLVTSTRDVINKFSIIKLIGYTRMLMWFRLSKTRAKLSQKAQRT